MPAKKKTEKQPPISSKTGKKGDDHAADVDESLADKIRREGIVTTFALNSKKMHRNVRDISVSNLTILLHGNPLVEEAELSLNYGNRYGLIGRNGCGKSTFMKVIGARCIPIPDGIDMFHLKEEIEASEMTAKEAVMSVDAERSKLESEAEEMNDIILSAEEGSEIAEEAMDRLNQIYERLEELDAATAEVRACKILSGLGFTIEMQGKKTREFSGGWRMRIALARALFIQPTLLLLDEPTNHLDMEAVVWLEDYLSKWNKILLMVSHSQDFLNSVCTHMMHFTKKKLLCYSGNYDAFVNTKSEKEEEQEKIFKREQDQIKHVKEYVARFGQGNAKMARQAQSKEKVLDKMLRSGLTEKVEYEKALDFKFPDPGRLSPPVLQCNDITFGYPGREILYANVDFGIDLDSRIALVGPNGAGKSTLLKIMTGDLIPLTGAVRPHPHLRISKFSQHFIDVLDLTLAPLDYFLQTFPELTREEARKFLGRFGVTGHVQTQVISQLSDGQKSRVVLAKMAKENPHILFLDEPTNHLDMESIDSLAKAINQFQGGLVLVSHDMRLISQVAKEIWLCDNLSVMKFIGEISDFKMQLRNQMQRNNLIDGDPNANKVPAPQFAPITPSSKLSGSAASLASVAPLGKGPPAVKMMAPPLPTPTVTVDEVAGKVGAVSISLKTKAVNAVDEDGEDFDGEEGGEVSKAEERALAKARRKVEKEAMQALMKKEEEEKVLRREEKLRDIEEAKKLKVEQQKQQQEFLAQKAALEAEKKRQEDLEAAEEAARIAEIVARKRQERDDRRRAKLEERLAHQAAARVALETSVLADLWTQDQQLGFEQALLEFTPMVEKEERWISIATRVPGKTKNQCILRYKYLKEYVAFKKNSNNSAIDAY